MRYFFLITFIFLSSISHGKITIKNKPLIFKEVRSQNNGIYKNKAKARGIIIIKTDDLERDKDKLVVFQVPKYVNLTNGKRWIKTKDIIFKNKDKDIIISEESTKVIYHVILDKRELTNISDKGSIEGTYTGTLPLHYSIYDKEL